MPSGTPVPKSNPPRRVIYKLRSAFPTEWRGEQSGVESAGQFVARDQKEWKQLWDAAHSNMYPIPKAPKLPRDKMAIAIFHGQTNESVTIRMTGLQVEPRKTVVEFEADSRPTQATVQREPFLLKFIDRTDKKVEFRQQPATSRPGPLISPRMPPF
jgi:hypothetical protein